MDRVGGRSSGISDSVQDGATRVIEAEERLSAAIRWSMVYARLDALFAGTPEGEVAQALYRDKLTAAKIAEARMVDRQTVRRLRDTYVTHAALLAAELGLVRMSRFLREEGST